MSESPSLIGIDMGASDARAWLYNARGDAYAGFDLTDPRLQSADGVQECLTEALQTQFGHPLPCPVIIVLREDGNGSLQLNWLPAPAPLPTLADHLAKQSGLWIIPGISQTVPADLTSYAPVALMGAGDASGLICVPGGHTRHLLVEDDKLVEFSTEMTGHLIHFLTKEEETRRPATVEQQHDDTVFQTWIERSLDAENSVPVFSVNAAVRLGQLDPQFHDCALSALLIGADIASHYDPGDEVTLIADGDLAVAYKNAFQAMQVDLETRSAQTSIIEGLFEIADLAGLIEE